MLREAERRRGRESSKQLEGERWREKETLKEREGAGRSGKEPECHGQRGTAR